MLFNVILSLAGLLILYYGAEWMVKGAANVATILGVTPVVVGLTVVAVGTSSPELVACLVAVYRDSNDIALGNVIGSNIANIGLVLATAAIIAPISAREQHDKQELPIMVLFTILFIGLCMDWQVSRIDGIILFALLIAFVIYTVLGTRAHKVDKLMTEVTVDQIQDRIHTIWYELGLTVVGMIGIMIGAYMLIESAAEIARHFGISELIIGVTIVAIGTSLPELATTVVAAFRRHTELAFGNIVGSNIFNIGLIMGITSMAKPLEADISAIWVELTVLLFFTLAMASMKWCGKMGRPMGIFLLVVYFGFMLWLGLVKVSAGA